MMVISAAISLTDTPIIIAEVMATGGADFITSVVISYGCIDFSFYYYIAILISVPPTILEMRCGTN